MTNTSVFNLNAHSNRRHLLGKSLNLTEIQKHEHSHAQGRDALEHDRHQNSLQDRVLVALITAVMTVSSFRTHSHRPCSLRFRIKLTLSRHRPTPNSEAAWPGFPDWWNQLCSGGQISHMSSVSSVQRDTL